MVMIQDASFKKPRGKNWNKRYVELQLAVSIKELRDLADELENNCDKYWEDWKTQTWLCRAFMEKCQCDYCKVGWNAYEKAVKELEDGKSKGR